MSISNSIGLFFVIAIIGFVAYGGYVTGDKKMYMYSGIIAATSIIGYLLFGQIF